MSSKKLDSWPSVSLLDVVESIVDNRGRSAPTSTVGIPLIATKCIKEDGLYPTRDGIRYVSKEVYDTWFRGHPSPGDVIIVNKGTPGLVCQVPEPVDFCIAQDMVALRPHRERVDPDYLLAALRSKEFKEQVEGLHVGTLIPHLKKSDFHRLRVPLPPLLIQQEIGGFYCDLSRRIELNRRMNRTLVAAAAAIFKSWFVDFDPVVAKVDGREPFGMGAETAALFPAHFTESAVGSTPEGWELGSIQQIARYINGRNFTKGATGTGRMVIRIAELNTGLGGSTVFNDVDAHSDNVAFPGDLLFSWSGSLDVYRWHREEALVNQHIFKVVYSEYPQWFVFHHLREAMPLFQGIAADKATTMGHIKREHLSHADVVLPPRPVLDAAGHYIGPLYDKVHQNERESLALTKIRDMLLPRLLSGELPVKTAEKMLAAV